MAVGDTRAEHQPVAAGEEVVPLPRPGSGVQDLPEFLGVVADRLTGPVVDQAYAFAPTHQCAGHRPPGESESEDQHGSAGGAHRPSSVTPAAIESA